MMQVLSHDTRCFIANAKGIDHFVSKLQAIKILESADKKGLLEPARKRQVINFDKLKEELQGQKNLNMEMAHLSQLYPYLYIFML